MVIQNDNDRINDSRKSKKSKKSSPRSTNFEKIALENILPNGSLKDNNGFKGKITSIRPPTSTEQSIELLIESASGEKLWILIKGSWIQSFAQDFQRQGTVLFLGKFGSVKQKGGPDHQGKLVYRVEYTKGVEFFTIDGAGDEKWFTVVAPKALVAAPSRTQEDSAEDLSMDFDDDLPISTDHSNQEKENYDRSAASGSSSLAVASAKASTSGTQAKSNAAGEGTRSDRERALLIRRFKHRKNWGMKVPAAEKRPVREYSNLQSLRHETRGGIGLIAIADPKGESYQIVKKSGLGDWHLVLYLFDPTLQGESSTINLFAEKKFDLPVVEEGDVVILSTKINAKDGKLTGYKPFQFAVLKQLDLVKNTVPLCETKPNRIRYGQEEIDYAKDLIGWSFSEVERKRPANEELVVPRDALTVTAERRLNSKGGSSSRKLVKFEDCSEGTFVDICGEVIKVHKPKHNDNLFDLYITDYTANEQAYQYSFEENDWQGPVGQYIFKVCIAQPFPDLNKLRCGTLVYIKNLKVSIEIELIKGGTWTDPKYPEKKAVTFFDKYTTMPGNAEFNARRNAYWADHRIQKEAWLISQGQEVPAPSSPLALTIEAPQPSVTCTFLDQQLCAIASLKAQKAMKDDSLVDKIFHCRGRVQGWYPQTLNDWIKAKCTTCNTEIPDGCVACLNHSQAEIDIYLEFVLQITDTSGLGDDEPASFQVNVSKKDYARFLPGITPTIEMKAPDNADILDFNTRIVYLSGEEAPAVSFDFAVTLGLNERGKKVWNFIGTSLNGAE